jgi:amino-acid N-acetyltransferase
VIEIEDGAADDFPDVEKLLASAQLPLDGLRDAGRLIVARANGRVVGAAALEEYGGGVLLRSVVVAEGLREKGVGRRLTTAALDAASRAGHRAAYLLTTTAGDFFGRLGFAAIDRADVPADVKKSVEFTSACPASALVMRAVLDAGRAGTAGRTGTTGTAGE